MKRLGFKFNIARYKSKTINHVSKALRRLVSYSCEICEVLYLLTQQASTGKKIHIQELVVISCCIQDQLLLMV